MPDSLGFLAVVAVGAIFGSFFNVVIARLPQIVDAPGHRLTLGGVAKVFHGLSYPPSVTPCCSQPIRWCHNIPIVSWLLLGGRCAYCKSRINARYLLVESITPLVFLGLFWQNGLTAYACALAILSGFMICLFFIDLETLLLPDVLTIPCGLIGLLLAFCGVLEITAEEALLGGFIGFLFPWSVAKIFYRVRRIEGLGGGDIKLLMAMGIWAGWPLVYVTLFLASLVALCTIVAVKLIRKKSYDLAQPVPFGPFLIGAYFATSIFKVVTL